MVLIGSMQLGYVAMLSVTKSLLARRSWLWIFCQKTYTFILKWYTKFLNFWMMGSVIISENQVI